MKGNGKVSTQDSTMMLFVKISLHRMSNHYLPKLEKCLNAVNKDQLWMADDHNLNSIGSITLHIIEHINRHIIRYANPRTIFNKGIEDYFPVNSIGPDELIIDVKDKFEEWSKFIEHYLQNLNESQLSEVIDMNSMYHLVEHTGYHLGQIVDRTKRISKYSFNFCQNGINEKNLLQLINQRENDL